MADNPPARTEGLVVTRMEEESILYNPATGKVHVLNGTGAFVWELLDGKNSADDIIKKIEEEYQADPETARQDFEEFVKNLKKMELVADG